MSESEKDWINDEEELPEISPEFAENVKRYFQAKESKGSSSTRPPDSYEEGLVKRIKADYPHLTEDEILEEIRLYI